LQAAGPIGDCSDSTHGPPLAATPAPQISELLVEKSAIIHGKSK
jgi:hypothetical protein